MRVIGSVEFGGVEHEAVWGSLASIHGGTATGDLRLALAVRTSDGTNLAVIARNAKLAEVEQAVGHLRGLGMKDSQLYPLFNYKGKAAGLAQHIKGLVSNLR